MTACASCGKEIPAGTEVYLQEPGAPFPDGPTAVMDRECADLDDRPGWTEPSLLDSLDAHDLDNSTPQEPDRKVPADAPPGDDYGAKQAAQILGVSPRRVGQLAQDGRLQVVQERPLRLSAQSVHELRAERRGSERDSRASLPPEPVAEQVERLLSLFTAESRRAIAAQEHLLGEVSTQRDELRAEVERLRAQVEVERTRADALSERLTTPPQAVAEDKAPRSWWKRR